tara:strand:- start:1829 stop:2068 length:240 start_codon:yes stop_codon:yes gene_type:complete
MDEPIMTKYEYTRIRGIRIQQLIDGMQPFVDYDKDESEESIFMRELKDKKIPLKITRPCGYNKSVDIPVSDMNVERFIN